MKVQKGDKVEFQDYRRCWKHGTVQLVEGKEVHVLYKDTFARTTRVLRLNPKRVRKLEDLPHR